MKRLIALGVLLIVGIELLALTVHDRRFVFAASGVALALVLLNVHRLLTHGTESEDEAGQDDLGDSLRRWLSSTRRRSVGRTPPGRTGTVTCVQCSHGASRSLPVKDRPKIR